MNYLVGLSDYMQNRREIQRHKQTLRETSPEEHINYIGQIPPEMLYHIKVSDMIPRSRLERTFNNVVSPVAKTGILASAGGLYYLAYTTHNPFYTIGAVLILTAAEFMFLLSRE